MYPKFYGDQNFFLAPRFVCQMFAGFVQGDKTWPWFGNINFLPLPLYPRLCLTLTLHITCLLAVSRAINSGSRPRLSQKHPPSSFCCSYCLRKDAHVDCRGYL